MKITPLGYVVLAIMLVPVIIVICGAVLALTEDEPVPVPTPTKSAWENKEIWDKYQKAKKYDDMLKAEEEHLRARREAEIRRSFERQ